MTIGFSELIKGHHRLLDDDAFFFSSRDNLVYAAWQVDKSFDDLPSSVPDLNIHLRIHDLKTWHGLCNLISLIFSLRSSNSRYGKSLAS